MKVLVACEESQRVCIAFRKRGHIAYSCDIKPCSGGHPEWHIEGDVRVPIKEDNWDLIIAHPPCTYLSLAGRCWTFGKYDPILEYCPIKDHERYNKGEEAAKFFRFFIEAARHSKVCIENPMPMKDWDLPRHSQIIQPWMFGNPYKKRTCLWLYGLPLLKPTNIVTPLAEWVTVHRSPTMRSKTFPGIAEAMATQWG